MPGNTGQPTEGKRMNLRTLAQHLRLSQTTVSLVLNNSPAAKSIPQATRDRVIEAARRLHYTPNYFARSLRTSSSMSVGVLAPDLSEGYFTLVMQGVQQHLIRSHYFYFTASHYWTDELIEQYPRMLMERAVDGFMLLNTPIRFRTQLPIVAISGHHRSLPNLTSLPIDNHKSVELALRHLYDLGHRRIAFMQGPKTNLDTEERWSSIHSLAPEFGLRVLPEVCVRLEAFSWSPQLGYETVKKLLARTRDFTALFCFNDISAIGAIRAVRDAGLSVPGDISVMGFDDIISAAFQSPSLTTIHQPLREMGSEGARILLERIKDPAKQFPAEILLEPSLVVRESTAAPAASVRKKKRRLGSA